MNVLELGMLASGLAMIHRLLYCDLLHRTNGGAGGELDQRCR